MPMSDPLNAISHDPDPQETDEWLEAIESLSQAAGKDRVQYILAQVYERARDLGIITGGSQPYSAYRNTIPVSEQTAYPGKLGLEERIVAINRWNALAMVVRANKAFGGLGGHIAS